MKDCFHSIGLIDFLKKYRGMSVQPVSSQKLIIEGEFDFTAESQGYDSITDSYHLQIFVPLSFPRELPEVYEIKGRIPRYPNHHINANGSLCLGSRIRLLWEIKKAPNLLGFCKRCLIPFLFAASYSLTHNGKLPFGELPHGSFGELLDYADLFGLETSEQTKVALEYLGMKKRKANKRPCPCGCGKRLGKCIFNRKLKKFRQIGERSWFRSLYQSIAAAEIVDSGGTQKARYRAPHI